MIQTRGIERRLTESELEATHLICNPNVILNYALPPCLNADDSLSNLPDECILGIFAYFDWRVLSRALSNLDVVKCVSQKMRAFANYQASETEKIEAFELRIVQQIHGHTFHLSNHYDHEVNYVYVIQIPKTCPESGEKYVLEERHDYFGIVCANGFNSSFFTFTPRTHDFPIPSLLFARLERLLIRYSPLELHLINISIDYGVLSKLEKTVTSKTPRIFLDGIVMHSECVKQLSQFLLKLSPESILVRNTDLESTGIFDEQFLQQFTSANKAPGYSLSVESNLELMEIGRFWPSETILDTLLRFSSINLISMTLKAVWICNLLTMRLAQARDGFFRFSISEFPDLREFHILPNCEFQEEGMDFVLKRKDLSCRVKFTVEDQYAPYALHAIFKNT